MRLDVEWGNSAAHDPAPNGARLHYQTNRTEPSRVSDRVTHHTVTAPASHLFSSRTPRPVGLLQLLLNCFDLLFSRWCIDPGEKRLLFGRGLPFGDT
ncbi:MAG: hypothetical protein IID46_04010 [Planctomycetes bacterium]|nr:hypothetical protein [Planctomycetota bacterium]